MVALSIIAVLCILAWAMEAVRHRRAARRAEELRTMHEGTVRMIRLAANDLRPMALSVFSYAENGQPETSALNGLGRRLLDMSENLMEQTESPDAPRFIENEEILLGPMVEFAMTHVAAQLGPGRRAWRVSPEVTKAWLIADRRAVNQVLVNVLSGAASATRDGDWIEVGCEASETVWSLVIQDEGIGLPLPSGDRYVAESRGLGLRLTLSRSLMKAHGGDLRVESKTHVGTRVYLSFPASRLLRRDQAVLT